MGYAIVEESGASRTLAERTGSPRVVINTTRPQIFYFGNPLIARELRESLRPCGIVGHMTGITEIDDDIDLTAEKLDWIDPEAYEEGLGE